MSESWQFTLNETSVHFLLAAKARHRQKLIHALEALAAEPLQRGDFEGKDDTGRPIQIKVRIILDLILARYFCARTAHYQH